MRTPVNAAVSDPIVPSPLLWATLSLLFTLPIVADERKTLPGHVPRQALHEQPIQRLPGSQRLPLALGLPLRNPEQLEALLQEIYNPASANYRHYLTPEEFTAKFGPTVADYEAVLAFARTNGLTVTSEHRNRMLLDVEGQASDIERAFGITLQVYRHPTEARSFFAPDTEPLVSKSLPLLAISGLNNYLVPRPMSLRTVPLNPAPNAQPLSGSGPGGSYLGSDFRAAYVPSVALSGAGQRVGLVEFDGYLTNDITTYESQAGLPSVNLTNVLLDGFDGTPGLNDLEVSLDIEMVIAMAPGVSQIIVYEAGPNGIPDDILNRMATDNLAKQLSASWTYPTDSTSEQIFQEFAAQGQSFFNASGDSGAYTGVIPTPAADTNITIVGGTTLTTSGPEGNWVSEKVWNWGFLFGADYAGSGGISTNQSIPPWQQGIDMTANRGSPTNRNIPDVAMTADNVWVAYGNGDSAIVGGTSCATPLWAGLIALVNQQAVANHHSVVGFINPAIYAIGKGTNYEICFHDIIVGNNTNLSSPNLFYAVPGFDLCTGWGTPKGSALIDTLTPPDPFQVTPLTGFSAMGPSGGPFTMTSQSYVLTNVGTAPFSWSLSSTSLWLSVSPTGGMLFPGQVGTNVLVSLNHNATNLGPGIFSATVWFTNLETRITQNRHFTIQVRQSLVLNGGFETGNFSDWTRSPPGSGSSVSTNALYAHSGNYGAALTSTGSLAYLSQVVPTSRGQPYLLSFWFDSPDGKTNNQFTVTWNGSKLFDQVNLTAIGWTYLQFVVTGGGTNSSLEFGFQDNSSFLGLDDVSVSSVPFPAPEAVESVEGIFTMSWKSFPGLRYQVQYRNSLVQTNWTDLGAIITATSSTTTTIDRAHPESHRYYRLALLP